MPGASFVICGTRPARAVRRLAERRGVSVTGWVPDTRPYLDSAEVFVAPLRVTRGIQNKVLEAMAMGLPVVASTATWQSTQGDDILRADDAEEFTSNLVNLLRSETYRVDLG